MIHKAGSEVAGKPVTCKACKKTFLAPKLPAGGPPPVASADRPWSLHVDGHTQGPFALKTIVEQIQAGKIDGTTLAWKDGMGDWQPLAEIAVFQDALAAAKQKASGAASRVGRTVAMHHAHRPAAGASNHAHRAAGTGTRGHHGVGADEDEEPRHQRYVRGQGKRELIVGAWVAGGLACVALVVALVVSRKELPSDAPPPPVIPREVYQTPPEPTPPMPPVGPLLSPKGTTPTAKGPAGAPEQTLAKSVSGIEQKFAQLVAAHRKGDSKPWGRALRDMRNDAKALRACQFGTHAARVIVLANRMEEAANGIETTLKTLPWFGGVLGEGLEEKQRAEALRLNETEWLENWLKILRGDIQKIRDGGLTF